VQIQISTRHGALDPEQQHHLHDKAEKLLKYFGRLMAIEVAVDQGKQAWDVEILVSAEHKHDFVATAQTEDIMASLDQVIHKLEQQLRKYKEKVVDRHRGSGARESNEVASDSEPAS